MVEKATYWMCRCGKANDNGFNRCQSCEQKRKSKFFVPLVLLAVVAFLVVLGSGKPDGPNEAFPQQEFAFKSIMESWEARIQESPNKVASAELIMARNREIFVNFGGETDVKDWSGTVAGISQMSDGAGFSVALANANFVAGVHLGLGLNTLLIKDSTLYQKLLALKIGDKVVFSGQLQHDPKNEVVVLNYSASDAIRHPDLLFSFSDLQLISK